MAASSKKRIERERKTIKVLVRLYCKDHHRGDGRVLCDACDTFLQYANKRLSRCPYQSQKPTCANCPIHCYKKDMQEQARAIMRYSGPRLLFSHPILALMHVIDGWKKEPAMVRNIKMKK